MKLTQSLLPFLLLAAAGAQGAPQGPELAPETPTRKQAAKPKLLVVTESKGFVHAVVKRSKRALLSHAERCIREAAKGRYDVVCTQDLGAYMRKHQGLACRAILMYSSGELGLDDTEKTAFVAWLRAGGALVGVHSATTTFYEWPEFGKIIGGRFDKHPWRQKVRIKVEDPEHPIVAPLAPGFEIHDEIYQFKERSEDVRVLLSLDKSSVDASKGNQGASGDYPLAWCRDYGRGRVAYCALGHGPEIWRDPRYLGLVLRSIDWAARRDPALVFEELLTPGLKAWRPSKGEKIRWKLQGEVLEVAPSSSSLMTRASFGDCEVDFEFLLPKGTPERGGDSGIVLQRHYEIQLLDGRGVETPSVKDCGAIYGLVAPKQHAAKGPEVWQRMKIRFRSAVFDASKKKVANARISVELNGVKIHDDVEIPGRTADRRPEAPGERPILLEDRGERVSFRKFRVARLPARKLPSPKPAKTDGKAPAKKARAARSDAPGDKKK